MPPLLGGHCGALVRQPVPALHQRRDRGVELQPLDVGADARDGPVDDAHVGRAVAGLVLFGEQPPGALGEPHDAGESRIAEVAAHLPVAAEQEVHPQVVGAVARDVLVGVDDVAAALGHLRALLHQQAVEQQVREWLGERQAEVVERHRREARVQVVAADVLAAARVEVDRKHPARAVGIPRRAVDVGRRIAQEVPRRVQERV